MKKGMAYRDTVPTCWEHMSPTRRGYCSEVTRTVVSATVAPIFFALLEQSDTVSICRRRLPHLFHFTDTTAMSVAQGKESIGPEALDSIFGDWIIAVALFLATMSFSEPLPPLFASLSTCLAFIKPSFLTGNKKKEYAFLVEAGPGPLESASPERQRKLI